VPNLAFFKSPDLKLSFLYQNKTIRIWTHNALALFYCDMSFNRYCTIYRDMLFHSTGISHFPSLAFLLQVGSVADPECLSRILSFIHPGSNNTIN
jgi:hypothetical protein